MARVKYQGTKKTRVSWSSMGKAFSYNVRPGEVISIADDQVNNIRAAGMFSVVSAPMIGKAKPKVNKKVIAKEEPVVKIVKSLPIVEEPVVEEPVVEEDPFEEVDTEEETKILPFLEEEEEEDQGIDYTSIRKAELKDMCNERGLHISGNRDDLIARLVGFDKGIILD